MIGIMLLGCTGFAQQTDSIRVPPTDTVLVAMHIDFLYQRIMDEVESLAEEGFESGMPDGSGETVRHRGGMLVTVDVGMRVVVCMFVGVAVFAHGGASFAQAT